MAVFFRLLCGDVVYSLLVCGSHGKTTLLKVQIFASVCMPHFSQKLMRRSVPVADATEAALWWGMVDAEIRFLLLSYPGSVNRAIKPSCFMPTVGQHIALHASPVASPATMISAFPVHSASFPPSPLQTKTRKVMYVYCGW